MDFSNVNLLLHEQLKLFIMRFYHPVSYKFIGKDRCTLENTYKFIESHYRFTDSTRNDVPNYPVYDLTDTYRRYCVYKRHQFYDTKVWQLIISVMAAIIASLLTNLIMVKV